MEVFDDKSTASIFEHVVLPQDDHALGAPDPSVRSTRVWLKMDLLVLPIVTLLFFIDCLGHANIGNARIAGLQQTLSMSDKQFSIAMTVAAIPPIFLQIPVNYLMIIVGPHILVPIMVALMGVSSGLQGVVATYPGFLACRFFTGLLQACLAGLLIYLACFYPRRMLQIRTSVMYCALALAPSISGLVAAAIVRLDGLLHKSGYAWLFLLEGAAAVVFGLIGLLIMPKSPTSVYFLRESEKLFVARALAVDNVDTKTSEHDRFWYEMRRVVVQPHVLLVSLSGFLADVTVSGLGVFLPSIVAGLGFEGSRAQLMVVPPFVVGAAFSLLTSLVSDRYGCRGLTIAFCATVAVVGFAIHIASEQNSIRYFSLFLAVPGSFSACPALATWQSNNTAPLVRRSAAIAFGSTLTTFGGILSVWLYGSISAPPGYTSATITLLAFQIGIVLCALSALAYLKTENRRKKLAREEYVHQHGERPPHGDPVSNESIWFEYVM
ncbi:MFS general substrate transporter [Polyporus arcularius HHB13444]|uniref:MFS general substrate transporter n=1 Tax=Polyporus arcularius HHB13444 TaxID=1314778 RepID=A0A5C3PIY9_9APHY|nr:MFS general substrate transporter [Polyporus arcularius HHB13444]